MCHHIHMYSTTTQHYIYTSLIKNFIENERRCLDPTKNGPNKMIIASILFKIKLNYYLQIHAQKRECFFMHKKHVQSIQQQHLSKRKLIDEENKLPPLKNPKHIYNKTKS